MDGLFYIGVPGDKDPLTGVATTFTDDVFTGVPGFSGWWYTDAFNTLGPARRMWVQSRCLGFNITDRTLGIAMRAPLRAGDPAAVTNVPWTRSGTTITFTLAGHGNNTGDIVTVSSSSSTAALPNGGNTLTKLTNDTFSVVGINAGTSSGTATLYGAGAGYTACRTREDSDAQICARLDGNYGIITGTDQHGIWWPNEGYGYTPNYRVYVWTGNPLIKPAAMWGGLAFQVDGYSPLEAVHFRNVTNTNVGNILIRGCRDGITVGPGGGSFAQSGLTFNDTIVQAFQQAAFVVTSVPTGLTSDVSVASLEADMSTHGYEQEEFTAENVGDGLARYQGAECIQNVGGTNITYNYVLLRGARHGGISIGTGSKIYSETRNVRVLGGVAYLLDHPLADMREVGTGNCADCLIQNFDIFNQSTQSQPRGDIDLLNVRWFDSFSSGREDMSRMCVVSMYAPAGDATSWDDGGGYNQGSIVGQTRLIGGGIFTRRPDEVRGLKISAPLGTLDVAANTFVVQDFIVQNTATANTAVSTRHGIDNRTPSVWIYERWDGSSGPRVLPQTLNRIHFEYLDEPTTSPFLNVYTLSTDNFPVLRGYSGYGMTNISTGPIASYPYRGRGKPSYRKTFTS